MQGIDDKTRELIQKRVLKKVTDIPSIPQFVMETLKKLDDPKSSAQDVANKLSRDEGLVIRILRLSNSAFYGLPRRISNIADAIPLLGFKTVKSIVMAASVYKFMDASFVGYALDRGQLWKHSMAVAYAARYIAARQKKGDPEEAYLAGLVHDLGKIALNDYVRFGYNIIVNTVEDERMPFIEAERKILGFDHAQVGGMILEQWNLPVSFILGARYHHSPAELEEENFAYRNMVDVVHVANALCLLLGEGIGSDGLLNPIDDGSLERLGITDGEALMSEIVDLIMQSEEEIGAIGDM